MRQTLVSRVLLTVSIAAGLVFLFIFGPLISLPLTFALAGCAGSQAERCLGCLPEQRLGYVAQLGLILGALGVTIYVGSLGGFRDFDVMLAVVGFVIFFGMHLFSNLGGALFVRMIDKADWTPAEEEIALRPIRLLIERENYRQALGELEELLKKRKPTYEAVLTRAKLLHHIGRTEEARTALLSLIPLSQSAEQQLAAMQLLASTEETEILPPRPPATRNCRVEIGHELILFQTVGEDATARRVIPPGSYEVAEFVHRHRLWVKLSGEDWGNDERFWQSVLGASRSAAAPAREDFISRLSARFRGKSRRQILAESVELFREANARIRRQDWAGAAPLLEQAAAGDPDRFEIAYRWVEAVGRAAGHTAAAEVLQRALQQSLVSKSEEEMLKALL